MRVARRNVIHVSNICNKIFRGFRSTGGQSPRFPIDFAVIVTTVLRGSAACDLDWTNVCLICFQMSLQKVH